ncbi:tetratricopeptide repeat protein [Arthrobacter sp. ISL-65]|uniref:tetratricopeptide repeat protein n=1 Tax=Arthrobacter sp. ISL-65 TaxID=2819112 RepID=UPI001BE814F7|nr:tetratricopeptide repeat protein [Arthrobacter sp. ISL-65]MBT2549749.1 tetratricopeptide repeat protein [Arthrobacter sp. ISL-65]
MLPGRGRTLSAAAARAELLLTSSSIAGESCNHRQGIDLLREAVGHIEPFPASKTREIWLAEILTRLGNTQRLAGQYGEASVTLTAALNLAGWDSLEPLRKAGVLNAQGILAKDTGRFEESKRFYTRALELMTGALGSNAPELASVHHNLAGLLHAQGRFDEAEPEALRALALRNLSVPPDPTGEAADMSVLGAVLAGEGRLDEAENRLRTALQIWESFYGPDHYEVGVQLNNLASIQQTRGDIDAASTGYRRALEIKERVLGRDHPEVAALLNNIAAVECARAHRTC